MTNDSPTHHTLDIGALILIIGSFAGYMPVLASGLAIIWYCILIFDRLFKKRIGRDAP